MGDVREIVDAEFEVVGGPYRVGDEHRREKGWYFTGQYNASGDPLFMRHPSWWRRRAFIRRWYPLLVIVGIPVAAFATLALLVGLVLAIDLVTAIIPG
ncbi:MAG: hypothetical protein ACK4YQ_08550 [Phenylobacterium sp.]|uniref:hypothetical protein n=1 Tax=Phenylobacterium sp. TaxID=1871053 RepID=UPI00391B4926